MFHSCFGIVPFSLEKTNFGRFFSVFLEKFLRRVSNFRLTLLPSSWYSAILRVHSEKVNQFILLLRSSNRLIKHIFVWTTYRKIPRSGGVEEIILISFSLPTNDIQSECVSSFDREYSKDSPSLALLLNCCKKQTQKIVVVKEGWTQWMFLIFGSLLLHCCRLHYRMRDWTHHHIDFSCFFTR